MGLARRLTRFFDALSSAGDLNKGCAAVVAISITFITTSSGAILALYSPPFRGIEFNLLKQYTFSSEKVIGIQINNAGDAPEQEVVIGFSRNAIPNVLEVGTESNSPMSHARDIGLSEYSLGSLAPGQAVVIVVRLSAAVSITHTSPFFYIRSANGEAKQRTSRSLLERYFRPFIVFLTVAADVFLLLLLFLVFAMSWLAKLNSEPTTGNSELDAHRQLARNAS